MNDATGTMASLSNHNFGLLIAHLLPGFITLWGFQSVSPTVAVWLSAASSTRELPTVGGFLYVTLASIALGMIVGAVRWCVVDRLHHHTGLRRPSWDDSRLQINLQAFDLLVEHHYRYYQFYANTIVAVSAAYAAHRWSQGFTVFDGRLESVLLVLNAVLWMASRDSLERYYARAIALMNSSSGELPVTNGSHPKPNPAPKPGNPKPAETQGSKPKDD